MRALCVILFAAFMGAGLQYDSSLLGAVGLMGMICEIYIARLELWFIARPRLSQWLGDQIFPALKPNNRSRK